MKRFRLPSPQAWIGGILLSFFLLMGMIYAQNQYLNGLLREYVRLSPVFVIAAVVFASLLQLLLGWNGPQPAVRPEHFREDKRVFVTAFCFFRYLSHLYRGFFIQAPFPWMPFTRST